mmetsp:Transcript_34072/g.78583  ORF Transcript_34072/g.78583 Transcript_34072/m.78583 type:complete len:240 (-) Transcript_34072:369-1088(-)
MPFPQLGHVNPRHGIGVIKQKLGKGFTQFRFSRSGGSHKEQIAQCSIVCLQLGSCQPYTIADCFQSMVLSHHSLPKFLFHVHELGRFAFRQTGHGYSCVACYNGGNRFGCHSILQHLFLLVGICLLYCLGQLGNRGMQKFPSLGIISLVSCCLQFHLGTFQILLKALTFVKLIFFLLPFVIQPFQFLRKPIDILLNNLLLFVLCILFVFVFQSREFDLLCEQISFELPNGIGFGFLFQS